MDSDQPAPAFTFPQAGDFPVTLTVTDANGTSDSLTQTVSVTAPAPPVSAQFAFTPQQPEANQSVQFTSEGSTGQSLTFAWDFNNDGQPDSDQPAPTFTFPQAGDFPVTLTVTDANGTSDSLTQTVSVSAPLPPVGAQFAFTPQQPEANQSVQFTSEGSTGQSLTFAWDFNNDGQPDSDQPAPTFTFPQAGDFPVTLTVTDANGTSDSLTQTVSVTAPAPPVSAQFAFTPQQPEANQSVQFTSEGSTGQSLTFAWDFNNDGQPDSDQPAPTFTFPQAGDFPVTLTVTDANGTSDSLTQTVSVAAPAPPVSAQFAFTPQQPEANQSVQFTSEGSTGQSLTFAWDFNNDGQPDSDQPAPTFTFPQAGDFPVTLTVTDANGTSDSLTQTVSVAAPAPRRSARSSPSPRSSRKPTRACSSPPRGPPGRA